VKKAVMLLNMGGPNGVEEVEMFLRNMFADEHILTMNALLRRVIGEMIVKKRLDEVKDNFVTHLSGKSPLPELTQRLIQKLEQRLTCPIVAAMRYVPPFARPSLERFQAEGVESLILFPMYPQYSTTTTLSSVKDIQEQCRALGYAPKITVIEPYYDDYDYITMVATKIMEAMGKAPTSEYDLLLSAHGLPLSIIQSGDPYQIQVEANVSALKIYLHERGVTFHDIKLVYQSKVGSAAWLEPNLVDVLRRPTHRKVVIYPLAFTIDNSETRYELDIEHREIARKIGYEDYRVARCFNDDDAFADFIAQRVRAIS